MHDAALVRGREPLRDLRRDLERLANRERAFEEALAQCLAFEELHHRVGASRLLAEIENGEDVRMRQGGDRARFA